MFFCCSIVIELNPKRETSNFIDKSNYFDGCFQEVTCTKINFTFIYNFKDFDIVFYINIFNRITSLFCFFKIIFLCFFTIVNKFLKFFLNIFFLKFFIFTFIYHLLINKIYNLMSFILRIIFS